MYASGKKRIDTRTRNRRTEITPSWAGLETLESRLLMSATPYGPHPRLLADRGDRPELEVNRFTFNEPAGTTGDASTAPSPGTSYSATGVPIFHSLIGASATLYLDFDGHHESNWGSYRNVSSPAYDIDGNATSFSATELGRIREIWARVAEDYAPFNIDVTTEAPGSFANGAALRIVIGGSSYDWYGSNAGGVCYVDAFTNSIVNTGYVFPAQLGNGATKYVAEAVSHESGHGFGLEHQSTFSGGKKTNDYNPGGGGWAPIMGNSYSQDLTTWHNGQSVTGAYQDDLARIGRNQNKFGFRPDDHGNSGPLATALRLSGSSVSAAGLIGASTDVDAFYFDADPGDVSFNVAVASVGANLDTVVSLMDALGNTLVTASPSTSLGASIATTLTVAGRYFLHVTSTGLYGRLGSYSVSGSIVPGTPPPSPEIAVADGTTELSDGQTTPIHLGSAQAADAGPSRTFTVTNTGNRVLSLGSIALPTGFILSEPLVGSLETGASDTFTVTLDTSAAGNFAGVVSFSTSDTDEPVFDFAVSGSVTHAPGTTVTLTFDGREPASFYDADGDLVTVSLKGKGAGTLTLDAGGNADAASIVVDNTNAHSSLHISTASGSTTVHSVTVNGSLDTLSAPTTSITGSLTITGSVKKVTTSEGTSLYFDNQRAATYHDASGDRVRVSLRGLGRGVVAMSGPGIADAAGITVEDTGDGSILKISVGRRGQTTVGGVTVNGSLHDLSAFGARLTGVVTISAAPPKAAMGHPTGDDAQDDRIDLLRTPKRIEL